MKLKKPSFSLILVAVVVGAIAYAAAYIPLTAFPAATILPNKTEQKPQFLFSFGNTGKGKIKQPIALATDKQGKIYVTDAGDSNVKVYSPNGQYIKSFGSKGTGNKQFAYPYGIAVLPNGDLVVADSVNLNVRVFSNNGSYKRTVLDTKQKIRPGSLAINDDGQICISDLLNHQIVVIDSQGKVSRKLKPVNSSLKYPQEVVIGQGTQELWVADSGNFAVKRIDQKGLVTKTIREWGNPRQPFSLVRGIGVDNLNRLMVADTVNGTIRVMTQDGKDVFSFDGKDSPAGAMIYPSFIWVDGYGKIYITDRGTGLVQVWGYQEK
jgi:DNA-binding beta-propeller fold protein YncE